MKRRMKVILLTGLAVTVLGTAGTLAAGAGQTLRLRDGTCQLTPEQGIGQGFVDENGDGICDNMGTGIGAGAQTGQGFVDENDDGICDNREGAMGLGGGAGRHGGRGWKN